MDTAVKSVVVACTLRSGSNLLCELLARRGYGLPTEFFQAHRYRNSASLREYSDDTLPSLDATYAQFVASQAGRTWRGVKWNWAQYNLFASTIGSEGSHRSLEDWLPNAVWIRLSRRSLVGQAVSMFLAKITKVWVAGEAKGASVEPVYDFDAIWREFTSFAIEEAMWVRFLEAEKIPYVAVTYEDLVANYGREMRKILAVLDPQAIDSVKADDSLPADLRNQPIGHAFAAEFAERFLADLAAGKHTMMESDQVLSTLVDKITNVAKHDAFEKFMAGFDGAYISVRKVRLLDEAVLTGAHQWVERSHFLDGGAVRLDAGSSLVLPVEGRRLLVNFLAHDWSGVCEITCAGKTEIIDLYSPMTFAKPWLIEFPATQRTSIMIRPLARKSAISNGTEVWVQRIWTLSDI